MKEKKSCECCDKEFEYRKSRRPNARWCSLSCLSKGTKKEQDEKRQQQWANESHEEYIKALSQRFEKYVIKRDKCWDWNGAKNPQGYGCLRHRNQAMKAHRASYIINYGNIPNGLWVLHKCDNPSCSNPEHLFLGDNTVNMRDMAKKKRTKILIGEANKASVLTLKQVRKIKNLLKIGVSCMRLSKDYKVNINTIYSIKYGKTWKHA